VATRGLLVDREELARILDGRICSSLDERDFLACNPNLKGVYSVTSGYQVLDRQKFGMKNSPWWKFVWNKFGWPKCNYFLWLVAQNRCLT